MLKGFNSADIVQRTQILQQHFCNEFNTLSEEEKVEVSRYLNQEKIVEQPYAQFDTYQNIILYYDLYGAIYRAKE